MPKFQQTNDTFAFSHDNLTHWDFMYWSSMNFFCILISSKGNGHWLIRPTSQTESSLSEDFLDLNLNNNILSPF